MSVELSTQLLNDALNIAKQAGERLLAFYRQKPHVEIKKDNTPVTNADLSISQFLVEQFSALTPDVRVLSEENCSKFSAQERHNWSEYWLIDPLDGTQQFIDHTDQFSVLIALVQNGQPVLGIIHSPVTRLTFYAMQGYGAFKQHENQIIKLVTKPIKDGVIRIAVGNMMKPEAIMPFLNDKYNYQLVHFGSSGLKGTLVAEGRVDCYLRIGKTGEWDTAAVACLLNETGGKIYDMNFVELTYNQRDTLINPYFIMVGNPHLPWHEILQPVDYE